MRDILYKDEELVFSLRVGGILVRDGHILLQNGLKVYPLELVPHILADSPIPVHFVSREG